MLVCGRVHVGVRVHVHACDALLPPIGTRPTAHLTARLPPRAPARRWSILAHPRIKLKEHHIRPISTDKLLVYPPEAATRESLLFHLETLLATLPKVRGCVVPCVTRPGAVAGVEGAPQTLLAALPSCGLVRHKMQRVSKRKNMRACALAQTRTCMRRCTRLCAHSLGYTPAVNCARRRDLGACFDQLQMDWLRLMQRLPCICCLWCANRSSCRASRPWSAR